MKGVSILIWYNKGLEKNKTYFCGSKNLVKIRGRGEIRKKEWRKGSKMCERCR
jgi:hypothetical protein